MMMVMMQSQASIGMSVVIEDDIPEDFEPSEEEIHEYAKWLGMDLSTDQHLLWIARVRGTPLFLSLALHTCLSAHVCAYIATQLQLARNGSYENCTILDCESGGAIVCACIRICTYS